MLFTFTRMLSIVTKHRILAQKSAMEICGYKKQVSEEHVQWSLFCIKFIFLYVNVYIENL